MISDWNKQNFFSIKSRLSHEFETGCNQQTIELIDFFNDRIIKTEFFYYLFRRLLNLDFKLSDTWLDSNMRHVRFEASQTTRNLCQLTRNFPDSSEKHDGEFMIHRETS